MARRTVMRAVAGAVALSTLVAACADDDEPSTEPTTSTTAAPNDGVRTLGVEDDGSEVVLAVGDELAIALEVGGGTGYSWAVLDEPDETVVEVVETSTGPTTATSAEDAPMTGRPETARWLLRATGEGETTIRLGLLPPGGDAPEDTVLVRLVVRA